MTRPLVLYHGPNCADGFASAWAAWRHFGKDADYLPVNYGDDPPADAFTGGRRIWILDFSYPREMLLRIAETNNRVVVLDHHRSAQQALDGLAFPGLSITFDMAKSGGRLAWEHFHPQKEPSWLVQITEDRDLWLWKLHRSREISAAIASYPFDFLTWDEWDKGGHLTFSRLADEGSAILRYQDNVVASACKNAVETIIGGHAVLAVNATSLQSEIAGKLAIGRPFGACFVLDAQGHKIWSLRSRDGGLDVSEIAKANGGGGHRAAAGYREG